jgi:hypothetical protein
MKRSSLPFPLSKYKFCEKLCTVLEYLWSKGCFDEYSDNHFLIQSINNNFPDYRTKSQIESFSSPAYSGNLTAINFCINLNTQLRRFLELCGNDDLERFVRDQLSAGKDKYNEDTFFQALHEIHVLRYFTCYGTPDVTYEPKIGGVSGKKNPEYRIKNTFAIPGETIEEPLYDTENYILDIEVKTIVGKSSVNNPFIAPIIPIQPNKQSSLVSYCHERGFNFELPDVIHLKEFLNSAADKFVNTNNKNHFNLLFLNWTHREIPFFNFIEPLSLLDNHINGLLRYQNLGEKFGISSDTFSKIDAIFIHSYPKQALIFSDLRWCFQTKQCAVLLNPKLTEEQKNKLTNILSMSPTANPKIPLFITSPPLIPNSPEKLIFDMRFCDFESLLKDVAFK